MEKILYDRIKFRKERVFKNTDIGALRYFELLNQGEVVDTFPANEVGSMARDAGINTRGMGQILQLEKWLQTRQEYKKV